MGILISAQLREPTQSLAKLEFSPDPTTDSTRIAYLNKLRRVRLRSLELEAVSRHNVSLINSRSTTTYVNLLWYTTKCVIWC